MFFAWRESPGCPHLFPAEVVAWWDDSVEWPGESAGRRRQKSGTQVPWPRQWRRRRWWQRWWKRQGTYLGPGSYAFQCCGKKREQGEELDTQTFNMTAYTVSVSMYMYNDIKSLADCWLAGWLVTMATFGPMRGTLSKAKQNYNRITKIVVILVNIQWARHNIKTNSTE